MLKMQPLDCSREVPYYYYPIIRDNCLVLGLWHSAAALVDSVTKLEAVCFSSMVRRPPTTTSTAAGFSATKVGDIIATEHGTHDYDYTAFSNIYEQFSF